jgi:hypothetical protein
VKKTDRYQVSTSFRLITCLLAVFFVTLAVFDGFEQEQLFEIQGEAVAEAEFDYVDFPTSISRPSGNSINKFERTPVLKIYQQLSKILSFSIFKVDLPQVEPNYILSSFSVVLKHTLRSNAP